MSKQRMKIPADWTFKSHEVASHFDQHVNEQLPWYELITKVIVVIARHYIEAGGLVYDIGCSTGNITRSIQAAVASRKPKFIGIDDSPDMKEFYPHDLGKFVLADACDFPYKQFDLAVCYLFLQFIPLEKRQTFLSVMMKNVKKSGAIIIVDKFISPQKYCYSRDIFRRITLSAKRDNGAPSDEILSKELSICGVQRPLNPNIISEASDLAFEFFRFGEFAGWIIPGSNE